MSKAVIKKLEAKILENFELIDELQKKDFTTPKVKDLMADNIKYVDMLNSLEQTENRKENDSKRLEYEKEVSEFKNKLESEKNGWQEKVFEMTKVLSPMVLSLFGYSIFQKRLLNFEMSGRICTFAGRELHLPKFTK